MSLRETVSVGHRRHLLDVEKGTAEGGKSFVLQERVVSEGYSVIESRDGTEPKVKVLRGRSSGLILRSSAPFTELLLL